MKIIHTTFLPGLAVVLLAGCASETAEVAAPAQAAKPTNSAPTLRQARQGFKTQLNSTQGAREPVEVAPAKVFQTLKYPSSAGQLAAYVSPAPRDGKKHPAIVWITGGDCNSIGDVWTASAPDNDQTAAQFRQAGIVMMFPSLRGGNDNPGQKEGFLGEVNDVLAAADFLAKQPFVDPKRIYLGGHSTGGTLALLVAQTSPRFRATFAFGPVENPKYYGDDSGFTPFDTSNEREVELRAPEKWLGSVGSPTFVIEGTQDGNIDSLRALEAGSSNPQLKFVAVQEASHFSVLAPVNALLARKILADTGQTTNISLSSDDATGAWKDVFQAPATPR